MNRGGQYTGYGVSIRTLRVRAIFDILTQAKNERLRKKTNERSKETIITKYKILKECRRIRWCFQEVLRKECREEMSGDSESGAKKVRKGVRRMPRLLRAKKDAISCEKPGRGANNR